MTVTWGWVLSASSNTFQGRPVVKNQCLSNLEHYIQQGYSHPAQSQSLHCGTLQVPPLYYRYADKNDIDCWQLISLTRWGFGLQTLRIALETTQCTDQTAPFRCQRLPSTFVMTNFDDNMAIFAAPFFFASFIFTKNLYRCITRLQFSRLKNLIYLREYFQHLDFSLLFRVNTSNK